MANSSHLWAVGYDDMERANQVRDEIISLGWHKQFLLERTVAKYLAALASGVQCDISLHARGGADADGYAGKRRSRMIPRS